MNAFPITGNYASRKQSSHLTDKRIAIELQSSCNRANQLMWHFEFCDSFLTRLNSFDLADTLTETLTNCQLADINFTLNDQSMFKVSPNNNCHYAKKKRVGCVDLNVSHMHSSRRQLSKNSLNRVAAGQSKRIFISIRSGRIESNRHF